jgi:hypothetical protein
MRPESRKATGNSGQEGGKKPDVKADEVKNQGSNGEHFQFRGKPMPRRLPTVTLRNGKTYFVDLRLREMRNINNPHDRIGLSSIIK